MDDGRWTMDDGRWMIVAALIRRLSSVVHRPSSVVEPSRFVAARDPAPRYLCVPASQPGQGFLVAGRGEIAVGADVVAAVQLAVDPLIAVALAPRFQGVGHRLHRQG